MPKEIMFYYEVFFTIFKTQSYSTDLFRLKDFAQLPHTLLQFRKALSVGWSARWQAVGRSRWE